MIKGLPHADGLVVGYLPKEKILVYADMFNLPPADAPGARIRRWSGTMVFRGQHRAAEAGRRPDHVGAQPESRSADVGGGHQGVAREEVSYGYGLRRLTGHRPRRTRSSRRVTLPRLLALWLA